LLMYMIGSLTEVIKTKNGKPKSESESSAD
jgi:hypothetical protein